MSSLVRLLFAGCVLIFLALTVSTVQAQSPLADDDAAAPPSMARPSMPRPSDRTLPSYYNSGEVPHWIARNQFEMEQRTLRLEYYRWIGYEPLRPTINANPSMSASVLPAYALPLMYKANPFYPRTVYGW